MERLYHGLDALCEADDVAIEAFQVEIFPLAGNAYYVDSPDGTCFMTYLVEIGDDLLLVGYRDVESS